MRGRYLTRRRSGSIAVTLRWGNRSRSGSDLDDGAE